MDVLHAAWWIPLYWLAIGLLIFFANRAGMKYAAGSVNRKRADVVLGVAIVLVPVVPLIVMAAWLLGRA